jgi:uncharacterized damage-inducible protein DinB
MNFIDAYLPEFDQEMATTRKLLEIVPADHADWKPHPKASTLGYLAAHLATLPSWGFLSIESPEFNVNPDGTSPKRGEPFQSAERSLEIFDGNVAKTRAAIGTLTPEALAETWTLKNHERTIISMGRAAVLRTFVLNHMIHHRGQLSVYLRTLDVKLPSIYGPTADAPL